MWAQKIATLCFFLVIEVVFVYATVQEDRLAAAIW
jgi:hypothetical protein